ncbi:MAG: response regulator transcription factor [Cryobacterium sp.]|nr:response regulator transcription factor [Cryobacterium sp.]MBX3104961.1 response regulator transcription factor [Cryobacterium sp.]
MPSETAETTSAVEPGLTSRKIRLAILDDHELLLDSFATWVNANAPDFDLAVVANTWLDLVQDQNFPTDLILMDFQLNEPVSIEARIRTCRAAGAKVVIISGLDTSVARERSLNAGAISFLSKVLPIADVMQEARRLMGHETQAASEPNWRPLPIGARQVERVKLSESEITALKLYVSGLSTSEVAERMDVHYETAKTFLRRVRQKYSRVGRSASRKTDLLLRAAEDGYLE